MIPVGYMAKRVEPKPEWLKANRVKDLYSVSGCFSKDFANYIEFWKHNGYWFFNSPEEIYCVAKENDIEMSGTKIFYYEVYEFQCYENSAEWELFEPDGAFTTNVKLPSEKILEGFDVVSLYNHNVPDCSYLSCNHMAEKLNVNDHCLLSTFDEAKAHLENQVFEGCEPGPCRIFAVYSI